MTNDTLINNPLNTYEMNMMQYLFMDIKLYNFKMIFKHDFNNKYTSGYVKFGLNIYVVSET